MSLSPATWSSAHPAGYCVVGEQYEAALAATQDLRNDLSHRGMVRLLPGCLRVSSDWYDDVTLQWYRDRAVRCRSRPAQARLLRGGGVACVGQAPAHPLSADVGSDGVQPDRVRHVQRVAQ